MTIELAELLHDLIVIRIDRLCHDSYRYEQIRFVSLRPTLIANSYFFNIIILVRWRIVGMSHW